MALLAIAGSGLAGLAQRARRRRRGTRAPSRSRLTEVGLLVTLLIVGLGGAVWLAGPAGPPAANVPHLLAQAQPGSALAALRTLAVKGRAPKTGYSRLQFGPAWSDVDHNGCDTRDDILRRDLTLIGTRAHTAGCVVVSGVLADPYTGSTISFTKSAAAKVQIDHVVALSDAWQTGAQGWPAATRLAFANDPLNLLAVDGQTNEDKGDGDAATWLPPRKAFRCAYVSRQVAVKVRYRLWLTPAERDAIARVLGGCPTQPVPA